MTDSPGANTTPLPTELSSLRQLSEESEHDNGDPFPTAPDTEAEVGEADQNLLVRNDSSDGTPHTLLTLPFETASGSSDSQHTSSDKLSALPSIFGHACWPFRHQSAYEKQHLGGLWASFNVGNAFAVATVVRAAPYRSLRACRTVQWRGRHHHDNAFRLTVIGDHQLALAQVSILFPWVLERVSKGVAGIYPAIQRRAEPLKQAIILHANYFFTTDHRHLPTTSEPIIPGTHGTPLQREHTKAYTGVYSTTRLISRDTVIRPRSPRRKRTAPSQVVHAQARPYAHPSPSRAISPLRTFFDRFSPLGRVYSREEPFIPIDPFRFHTPLSLNPFARCCGTRAQHTETGHRRGSAVVPVRHLVYVRMCAALWPRTFPQRTYIRI
jgi:hypothetical protein